MDRRLIQLRERHEEPEQPGPAGSSVDAAIYLIKVAPERLEAWMRGRDSRIETEARERLERYVFGDDS
jgi:hypothetical protein